MFSSRRLRAGFDESSYITVEYQDQKSKMRNGVALLIVSYITSDFAFGSRTNFFRCQVLTLRSGSLHFTRTGMQGPSWDLGEQIEGGKRVLKEGVDELLSNCHQYHVYPIVYRYIWQVACLYMM